MGSYRRLLRLNIKALLLLVALVAVGTAWFFVRPEHRRRVQRQSGLAAIHERDKLYLHECYDEESRKRLIAILGDSRLTHWSAVTTLDLPDRETVLSIGSDRALIVWNRRDGSIRKGFYDWANACWSPEAGLAFVLGYDGTLTTWSIEKNVRLPETLRIPPSEKPLLRSTPDGRYLLHSAKDGMKRMTVWDRDEGRAVAQIEPPDPEDFYSFIGLEGTTVVLVDAKKLVVIDLLTGECRGQVNLPMLEDNSWAVTRAGAFAEDGRRFYFGDVAGRVFEFNLLSHTLEVELPFRLAGLQQMLLRGDAPILSLCGNAGLVATYEISNVRNLNVTAAGSLEEMGIGAGGSAYALMDGRIDFRQRSSMGRMKGGPRNDATCFAFSPVSGQIALAGRDGLISLRSTDDWSLIRAWPAHDGWIRGLLWSPAGNRLASLGDDRVVALWDPSSGQELASFTPILALPQQWACFDPSGSRLFLPGSPQDATIEIFDTTSHLKVGQSPGAPFRIRGNFSLLPDGDTMVVGGSKPAIQLWSLSKGTQVGGGGPPSSADVNLAVSPSGSTVYASWVSKVWAYGLPGFTPLWSAAAHQTLVFDVSISPDGRFVATAGDDGTIAVLDAASGLVAHRFKLAPNGGRIWQVEFSPDGELLAAAMSNGSVVILRAPE